MSEKKQLYALLVGIDNFKSHHVTNLAGCVNDAIKMEDYLNTYIDKNQYNLDILKLHDENATRNNILVEMQRHLGKAKKGDIALFFCASHGSTETAHAYFGDSQLETLVCHDSRTEGVRDILDKEIRFLFNKLARNGEGPEIIMIQDTCHSGSGSRLVTPDRPEQNNPKAEDKSQRYSAPRHTQNPIEKAMPAKRFCEAPRQSREEAVRLNNEFMLNSQTVMAIAEERGLSREERIAIENNFEEFTRHLPANYNNTRAAAHTPVQGGPQKSFDEAYPEGAHIHLGACSRTESAYEINYDDDSPRGGVFTHTLINTLKDTKGMISYDALITRIRANISADFAQRPVISFVKTDHKRAFAFLSDKPALQRGAEITKHSFEGNPYWLVQKGGIHGLPILNKNQEEAESGIPINVFCETDQQFYKAYIYYVFAQNSAISFEDIEPPTEYCHALIEEKHFSKIQKIKVANKGAIQLSNPLLTRPEPVESGMGQSNVYYKRLNRVPSVQEATITISVEYNAYVATILGKKHILCERGRNIALPLNPSNKIYDALILLANTDDALKHNPTWNYYIEPNIQQDDFEAVFKKLKKSYESVIDLVSEDDADYFVQFNSKFARYELHRKVGPSSYLFTASEGYDESSIIEILNHIRKIANAETLKKLKNEAAEEVLYNSFSLQYEYGNGKFHSLRPADDANNNRFIPNGINIDNNPMRGRSTRMRLKLTNLLPENDLSIAALLIDPRLGISSIIESSEATIIPKGFVPLKTPGSSHINMKLTAPTAHSQGQNVYDFYVVVFVGGDSFDVKNWLQEGLPIPKKPRNTRSARPIFGAKKVEEKVPLDKGRGHWECFTFHIRVPETGKVLSANQPAIESPENPDAHKPAAHYVARDLPNAALPKDTIIRQLTQQLAEANTELATYKTKLNQLAEENNRLKEQLANAPASGGDSSALEAENKELKEKVIQLQSKIIELLG